MSGAGNYCRTDSAVPQSAAGAGPRSSTGLGEWRGWGPWGGGGGDTIEGGGGDTIGGGGGWWPRTRNYMMQGCHTPPPPPTPWYPPRPPCGVGPVVVPFPAPPVVSLLWWAVPLALFAVVPAAGGTAHDVVLQTATRVDNRGGVVAPDPRAYIGCHCHRDAQSTTLQTSTSTRQSITELIGIPPASSPSHGHGKTLRNTKAVSMTTSLLQAEGRASNNTMNLLNLSLSLCLSLLPQGIGGVSNPAAYWPPSCYGAFGGACEK